MKYYNICCIYTYYIIYNHCIKSFYEYIYICIYLNCKENENRLVKQNTTVKWQRDHRVNFIGNQPYYTNVHCIQKKMALVRPCKVRQCNSNFSFCFKKEKYHQNFLSFKKFYWSICVLFSVQFYLWLKIWEFFSQSIIQAASIFLT